MPNIRITKIFDFDVAHALYNYKGLCRSIHGHSYKLYVTVSGKPEPDDNSAEFGMLMDFGILKKLIKDNIVAVFDHSLLLYKKDNIKNISEENPLFCRTHVLDFQPTCENMVCYFSEIIKSKLPSDIKLFSLKLHETPNSYAEWFESDQN